MCEREIQLSQIRDVLLGPTEVPGNYALLDLNQIHICVSCFRDNAFYLDLKYDTGTMKFSKK